MGSAKINQISEILWNVIL